MELKGKDPKAISAVNAKDYGERFVNFMQTEVIEDPALLGERGEAADRERAEREAAATRELGAPSPRGSGVEEGEGGGGGDLPFMAEE